MEADMNKRDILKMLLIGCAILLVVSGVGFAAGRSSGYGTLTAIENDGRVVIRADKGQVKVKGKVEDVKSQSDTYLVYPAVRVQRFNGQRISLNKLQPPIYVYFEYEYTKNGFMIVLIKEVPR